MQPRSQEPWPLHSHDHAKGKHVSSLGGTLPTHDLGTEKLRYLADCWRAQQQSLLQATHTPPGHDPPPPIATRATRNPASAAFEPPAPHPPPSFSAVQDQDWAGHRNPAHRHAAPFRLHVLFHKTAQVEIADLQGQKAGRKFLDESGCLAAQGRTLSLAGLAKRGLLAGGNQAAD